MYGGIGIIAALVLRSCYRTSSSIMNAVNGRTNDVLTRMQEVRLVGGRSPVAAIGVVAMALVEAVLVQR